MRKLIILFAILIFWTLPALSQVATPSLDPALPNALASAVAWRVGSTIGIDVDYVNQDEDASDDAESKNTRQAVLIAYQPGNFVGELYYAPYVETKSYTFGTDAITVDWENKSGREYSARLAIRGNRKVSVGIGFEGQSRESGDDTQIYTHYEGSFSLRLFDGLLFLGAGMQRVSENLGSDDSKKMNRVVAGSAIQIGDPIDTIFKTEVSVKMNPKTESENGIMEDSPKTTESELSVELLTGRLLFSYRMKQLVYEKFVDDNDFTETSNRFGFGLKLGSFTIGLYRNAWTVVLDEQMKNYDIYQATVGYSFL